MEVVLLYQEREGNPGEIHEQEEAEPSVTRGLAPTPLESGVKRGTVDRPQRVRRPPAWFRDFVVGGDLDQFLAGSQLSNAQLKQVEMAQRQIDQTPLELQDMWHLSNDEDRKEKGLPGERLDISWVSAATRRTITDQFYKATAGEGKCTVDGCEYATLSRRKLLDHLVTHHIIYVTGCEYITSRRVSAVKHLRTCHNRAGSITQTDAGSWSRLRESNPNLPTSCPPLPISSYQYKVASRCSEERPVVVSNLPIAVKRIRTVKCQQDLPARPEQPPVVRVKQRVELRRRLARLREDYQSVARLKTHIQTDMAELEQQLGSKKKRC